MMGLGKKACLWMLVGALAWAGSPAGAWTAREAVARARIVEGRGVARLRLADREGGAPAYVLRLQTGPLCDGPTLFVGKEPWEAPYLRCGAGRPPGESSRVAGVCEAIPELEAEDPLAPGWSYPVRLRLETTWSVSGKPLLRGTVFWDCADVRDAATCRRSCTLLREDAIPEAELDPLQR